MSYHLTQAVRAEIGPHTSNEHAAHVTLTALKAMIVAFAEKDDDNSALMALGCAALARQLRATYFPDEDDDTSSNNYIPGAEIQKTAGHRVERV